MFHDFLFSFSQQILYTGSLLYEAEEGLLGEHVLYYKDAFASIVHFSDQ